VGCGLVIKIRGGEKISVVGHGNRRHPAARGLGRQFADLAGAIEQRVVGVEMKMNEIRRSHVRTILNQLRKIGYQQSTVSAHHAKTGYNRVEKMVFTYGGGSRWAFGGRR
jgi:hypothetical protein